MSIYEEIEIEDMTYDPDELMYTYPCPCGDKFRIYLEELWDGEDVAKCPSCTLRIMIIYEEEDLPELPPEEDEEEEEADEEEEKAREKAEMEERSRRKAELKAQAATPKTFRDSMAQQYLLVQYQLRKHFQARGKCMLHARQSIFDLLDNNRTLLGGVTRGMES